MTIALLSLPNDITNKKVDLLPLKRKKFVIEIFGI